MKRRSFLRTLAGLSMATGLAGHVRARSERLIRRPIPKSEERLPVIGMGSWLTFAVGDDLTQKQQRTQVLQHFFDQGGGLIDSSPMYGSSEEVIGFALRQLGYPKGLFAATKVWTRGWQQGVRQMEQSRQLWGVPRFDLMQIHNLLDWQAHLQTLQTWKTEGKIRFIGITTSHGRRHRELEKIMAKEEALDFVQFTYNIIDREAEQRLLPLAAERQLAVIINRPFQGGGLFDVLQGRPLPGWAAEFDCRYWSQFLLKFIVSHPAVTCAIPATSRVDHMRENMGAAYGRLPNHETRQRMLKLMQSL